MKKDAVVFRRINGRIVPIRDTHRLDAASRVTAGVAIAALAGAQSANMDRTAANFENVSRNIAKGIREGKSMGNGAASFAIKSRIEGLRHSRAAKRMIKTGAGVGAAFIGAGVHKSLENTKLKERDKAAIATASGLAAYVAARAAHTKIIGSTKKGFALRNAFKRVLVRGFAL